MLTQVTKILCLETLHVERENLAKLLVVPLLHPLVQQVKWKKEQIIKNLEKKEKIQPPTKSKSLTISPTCKQNDNSDDSLTP